MQDAIMQDAFILGGVRTPRGRASGRGALHGVSPVELVVGLCGALRERTGLDPRLVGDMILGCASQIGVQGANIARTASILADWDTPGMTINRFCASGIDAVSLAAARVRSGDATLLAAGGVESVSRVPLFADGGPLFTDPAVMRAVGSVHMGIAADLVATLEGLMREELDDYVINTRKKAREAWDAGRTASSLVAVLDGEGKVLCDRDELLGFSPSREELASFPPAFAALGSEGQDAVALSRYPALPEIRHVHTKGTSPPLADAAALLLIGNMEGALDAELKPRARIVASTTFAVDPVLMLTAGQHAVLRVLERTGLSAKDVDLFEFAEAFSALCIKFQRDLDVDDDRFNVDGGTLALGHAFGATGAILVLALVDGLVRRGGRYGIAAVSGAAGLGSAVLLERVA